MSSYFKNLQCDGLFVKGYLIHLCTGFMHLDELNITFSNFLFSKQLCPGGNSPACG